MIRHILIGGTPSSGSSLLSVLLDNHSLICCGPELSLFSHPFFWSNHTKDIWKSTLKKKILDNDNIDESHNIYNGFINHNCLVDLLDLDWYGISRDELVLFLDKTDNGVDFFIKWAKLQTKRHKKTIYCEKSPPNIFTCATFVDSVPESFGILCIRNPLDTINSLMRRGLKLYTAAAIWLCEAYIINLNEKKESIYLNKYEDLVNSPVRTLNYLFKCINIPQEGTSINELANASALSPDRAINSRESINTWSHTPFSKIENKSLLSGIHKLKKHEILFLRCLKLNKRISNIAVTKNQSFYQVAHSFGYSATEYGLMVEPFDLRESLILLYMVVKTKTYYTINKPKDIHKSSIHVSLRSAAWLIAISLLKYFQRLT